MTHSIARLVIVASAALAGVADGGNPRAPGPPEETTYHIRDLGSLGGTHSRGNSISTFGLVAGYSNLEGNQSRHATVWLYGKPFSLGTLGGPNSNVSWPGANKGGLVVGIAQTGIEQPRGEEWSCRAFFPGADSTRFTCLGFVWDGHEMKPLPTLGGDNGFAAGLNHRRQVVGWAENTVEDRTCAPPQVYQFRAVLWDLNRRNHARELAPLRGDTSSAATAINNRGQVVGISGTCDQAVGRFTARHAVLWDNGAVHDLGSLGGDTWNTPTSITERGDIIVGFASQPGDDPNNPKLRAFLWTRRDDVCDPLPGTRICSLGTLRDPVTGEEDVTSQAWGVNEWGQVVGTSCPSVGLCKAFLWERGVMRNLNDLKDPSYAGHLDNGLDINNLGQITGRVVDSANVRSAFVATPRRSR